MTVSRGASAPVYSISALELDSYITGDRTRTARYTYDIAGEADDALVATATTICIATGDVFTAPADHVAAGVTTWTSPEETILTLSHYGSGMAEGQTEMVLVAASEAYVADEYSYNPYLLRADDLDAGVTAFNGVIASLTYSSGNARGRQSVPGGVTLVEATITSDAPLPATAPLLLGALVGLMRLRRAWG
ncbi:MAG: hypothetical protein ACJAVS_001923 [Paracoccaceae bacterium]|jgi:hypothetical protein